MNVFHYIEYLDSTRDISAYINLQEQINLELLSRVHKKHLLLAFAWVKFSSASSCVTENDAALLLQRKSCWFLLVWNTATGLIRISLYGPAYCMVLYARGQLRRGGQQTGVEHQQPSTISDEVRSFGKWCLSLSYALGYFSSRTSETT